MTLGGWAGLGGSVSTSSGAAYHLYCSPCCLGFAWDALDFVHLLNSFLAKCLYGPFFSAPWYLLVNRRFLAWEGLYGQVTVLVLYWPM